VAAGEEVATPDDPAHPVRTVFKGGTSLSRSTTSSTGSPRTWTSWSSFPTASVWAPRTRS
jgi:hypothetical protein